MLSPFACWVAAMVVLTRTGSRAWFWVAVISSVAIMLAQLNLIYGVMYLHGWLKCDYDWSCSSRIDACRCINLRVYAAFGLAAVESVATVGLIVIRRSRERSARRRQ